MVTKNFFLPICTCHPPYQKVESHFPCPWIWADLATCIDKERGGRDAVSVLKVDLKNPYSFWFCFLGIQLPCCKEVQAPFPESEDTQRGLGGETPCVDRKATRRRIKAPQSIASAKGPRKVKEVIWIFLAMPVTSQMQPPEWPQATPCGAEEPPSRLKESWEIINYCCFKSLCF